MKSRMWFFLKQRYCSAIILACLLILPSHVLAENLDVHVFSSKGNPLSGLKVYAFTENGAYTGNNATTDTQGLARFNTDNFSDGSYPFRVDYLGGQFWSDLIVLPDDAMVSITIAEGDVNVNLSTGLSPLSNIRVYLFSSQSAYLGRYGTTDSNGQCTFILPVGLDVKFRADYMGYQFWSGEISTAGADLVQLDIPHHAIDVTVSGQYTGTAQAIEGVNVYLFTPSGSYLGKTAVTDSSGMVAFELPEKSYKVRTDYLGTQYWSDEFVAQNAGISIPMADAQIRVTGNGLNLSGANVYAFSQTGSYLGINGTTDANGTVLFRLPAGQYNFRADFQGNQFWGSDKILVADQVNSVDISTGGGTFNLSLAKAENIPLENVKCYLFNEAGAYLDVFATSDGNGNVSFNLSDGRYQFRIDYMGAQFWTDVFEVPQTLSATHLISHSDTTITVNEKFQGSVTPLDGLNVYLFNSEESYLGQSQVTDTNGNVIYNLPDQEYTVRADYLGQQFWSGLFSSEGTTLTIPMADAIINLSWNSLPLDNRKVYVFSSSGSYLGINGVTDLEGEVVFRLPAGTYKFRADYLGGQFWSGEQTIESDVANAIDIYTGGGAFNLTVLKDAQNPLIDQKTYLFDSNGYYLGIQDTTDSNGQITFDLPEGMFEFRIDTLGYQFWSSVYDVPEVLSDVLTIPHQDITVTIQGIDPEPTPLSDLSVYLFSPSNAYLGMTSKNRQ